MYVNTHISMYVGSMYVNMHISMCVGSMYVSISMLALKLCVLLNNCLAEIKRFNLDRSAADKFKRPARMTYAPSTLKPT